MRVYTIKQQRPSGMCRVEYDNGDVYDGFFNDYGRNGLGKLSLDDESIECGYWGNDKLLTSIPIEEYEKEVNKIENGLYH